MEGDGFLGFDDTGFAKQGKASVGVARQYPGTLGKVGNCQVIVNCHYAKRTVAWPVNTWLHLPESWANDPARRTKAQVPAEAGFHTKPELVLDLLDQACSWNTKHACVIADTQLAWPYAEPSGALEPAHILRQPVHHQLGDAAALGECARLVHHVGEVLGAHRKILVPLELVHAVCRCLEAGVGPAGHQKPDGDAVRPELRIEASRK